MSRQPPALQPSRPVLPGVLIVLLALNILPELILQMADRGLIAPPYLRALLYRLAAFQPDLLTGAGPLFPGQSVAMFFTYGFLHTGLGHLSVNMIALVLLGRLILSWRSTGTFVIFYLMSMVGAAEMFALIGPAQSAIAGASGALFGLLGIYLVDNGLLVSPGASHRVFPQVSRLVLVTLALALSDLLSQSMTGSAVAWQAHAGGFLTGALVALVAPPLYR